MPRPLQLTTGPTCICPTGIPDIWCGIDHHAHLAMQRELGLLHPPTRLCTCTYGLHQTLWNPTHLIDVPGVGQRGAAFTFRIDPFCTHHGEPQYLETLDEDERRGH